MAKTKNKTRKGGRFIGIVTLIVGAVCLPSAIIVAFGMLPTVAAALTDRARPRVRGWTIGAMNAAGCFPFLLDLWAKGNNFDASMRIISDPRTIIIIYSAAVIGYMIDWSLTGLVASLMIQRGERRRKTIEKMQADLVQRWWREVTGDIPLDSAGYPLAEKTS